jgi:hypothetical protein
MKERLTFVVGSIIVAGSIILAAVIRRPRVGCSHLGGLPAPRCPQPANDLMTLRVGIVIAGLIIAVLIVVGGRVWNRRHR